MNSTKNFILTWLALSTSGTLAFQNPVHSPGPDPSLVFADGSYYLTYTSGNRIEIVRSTTLGGLSDGDTKVIWTDSNSTRNANMWAPEMHQIDDVWYMFYSSCDSALSCCSSCQTRVLRGCDASGPYDCDYSFLADLMPPAGRRGGADANNTFSIDGTYLEIPDWGRYHVLSMANEDGLQSIGITTLDTDTWAVGGWNVISAPDQAWESNGIAINEGPHPLYHGGEIWLSYSGSYCGSPNYALGLLHWNGGDPLDKASWNKTGPVFSQANGNYGTGHNSFFKSPDGTQIWNAFHATSKVDGSCGSDRYSMAQIVTFDDDNNPDFGVPQPLSEEFTPPSGESEVWDLLRH